MGRRKKDEPTNGCGYGCLIIVGLSIVILIVNFIVQNAYVFIGLLVGLVVLLIVAASVFGSLQNQSNQEFQDRKQTFLESPDYIFIQQFARKYKINTFGLEAQLNELSKLNTLVQNKGWRFSSGELKSILLEEEQKQHNEIIKSKILLMNPVTFEEYVRSYIEVCGNNNTNLVVLDNLLQSNELYDDYSGQMTESENGFWTSLKKGYFDEKNIRHKRNLQYLEESLQKINVQIEMNLFEKRLLHNERLLTIEQIDSLNGYDFEGFLSDLYKKMGYQVEPTKLSGDQGADIVVTKFGEKTVIQAKRYSGTVGNKAVQEIVAAISLYKAQKGIVITNNYFTKSAVELAKANSVELIDRDGLKRMIENNY